MTKKIGDTIPTVTLKKMSEKGIEDFHTREFFKDKKVVVFAVPGAFTPTCSKEHLPGFIKQAKEFQKKGCDAIVCLAVNDAFVMDAWGKEHKIPETIMMIADGNGDFAHAMGLEVDLREHGMGTRSQRYAMIVENGIIKNLSVEPKAGCSISSAEDMLKHI